MFIRRMIHDQIHNNLYISLCRLIDKFLHIIHRTEFSHNSLIITDIISIIIIWRLVYRAKPDCRNPERLEII
ncbi:hypothetical protein D3C81_1726470 [compost metagenome]